MGQQAASILTVQQYLDEPPRPQAVRGRSTKTPTQRLIFFLASAGKLLGLLRFWLSPRLLRSGERSWKDNGHADQVQRGVQA